MKKAIYIIGLLLIMDLLSACCNCLEPVFGKYTHQSITLINLNNAGISPQVAVEDTVPKKAYGIRINLNAAALACAAPKPGFLLNSSYAFSCKCGPANVLFARDSMIQIQVFTQNDFDEQHLAGAELTAYFKLFKHPNYIEISDWVQTKTNTKFEGMDLNSSFDLLLMTAPKVLTQHAFKVRISLSDGRVFEAITSSIVLI
jgi:hypothetical protein